MSDESDEGGNASTVDDRYWPLPIDERVELVASVHSKSVNALAINNVGSRFATGGNDQEISVWDFNACHSNRPVPINKTRPCGQAIINSLDFSHNDEFILVIPESCQAKVLTREGAEIKNLECAKGDQYLLDMTKTKGHTQMLNAGCWNPRDNETFITSSKDGTIRIWNVNDLKKHNTVIKVRATTGLKTVPNSCKYLKDFIIAGCNDGSILMWDTKGKFMFPSKTIKQAHSKGSDITDVQMSHSERKLCSRSEDGSIKIWDLRNIKAPLTSREGLPNSIPQTACCFSPNDDYIATGTSLVEKEKKTTHGKLLFMKTENCEIVEQIEQSKASVIRCTWHPKINHILYTCSNGSAFILYDQKRSIDGMKLGTQLNTNQPKKRKHF